jgi:hypothetical protein
MDFTGGGEEDFTGTTLDAAMILNPNEITRLDISVGREPFQSFYADNNYYVSTRARLRLIQQVGRRIFWQGTLEFRYNSYPEPGDGKRRRDKDGRLEAGLGFQIHKSAQAYFGYNYQLRRSNIETIPGSPAVDPFDYTVNRLIFRIRTGWM